MRYHVLATDYDGTLATHGRVDQPTLDALERLLATGRRLVMVTGRELPELLDIFPQIDLFELVVAENGALLYRPSTKEEKSLGEPPSPEFVAMLRSRGVERISVGRSIVATWEPYEKIVLETIRDCGLENQVIFNKGAVMILPAGVNKASGLTAALAEMSLSPHNVVGIGDAENDHAFLHLCELGAAVANALPAVKNTADAVLAADHGAGVAQLIDAIIDDDLADYDDRLARRRLKFAAVGDEEVTLPPHGRTMLVCGPSASGKSTLMARLLESLAEQQYQFCLIDPEGDYDRLPVAVVVGGPENPPVKDETLQLLATPSNNVVVNLTGIPIPDRPPFFLSLLTPLLQLHSTTGRPHWLILDEAHHLLPSEWSPPEDVMPADLANVAMITVHPELLSTAMLARVDTLMVVGANPRQSLEAFCAAAARQTPPLAQTDLEPGDVLLWSLKDKAPPRVVRAHKSQLELRRHRRKYAEGELPPERSFYFRGPENKLKLRAQNLAMFLQLAEGIDDETWDFHLRRGDYSQWFRECIKDEDLATAAAQAEAPEDAVVDETRQLIRAAIEREYAISTPGALPVPAAS
jgi:HAD superfamily hydrolase (TIGR01484 family)